MGAICYSESTARGERHGILIGMDTADRAWLAGLFEGEGCFTIEKNGSVRAMIAMSDRDIIERVHALWPTTVLRVDHPKTKPWLTQKPKPRYWWRIAGPQVREFIELIEPWLGERRRARAQELLSHLAARPAGTYQSRKTHCAKGHPYSPENTVLGRDGNAAYRRCRICVKQWGRDSRARKLTSGQDISA